MIVLGNLYERIDSIGNDYKIKNVNIFGVIIENLMKIFKFFFIINDFNLLRFGLYNYF